MCNCHGGWHDGPSAGERAESDVRKLERTLREHYTIVLTQQHRIDELELALKELWARTQGEPMILFTTLQPVKEDGKPRRQPDPAVAKTGRDFRQPGVTW